MKILVTGGGGFQGSHLVELLLAKGHHVSVLNTYSEQAKNNLARVLSSINLIWGSVTDKELIEKSIRGHEVVFHLAARVNVDESRKDPFSFYHANVLGTMYILEAVRKEQARLIYASTCEVYGDGHVLSEREGLRENAELRPNSPYAASKAAADRMCHAYFKTYGVNVTIVRPFNVYGERQKSGTFGALIPILVSRALIGQDLTVFGDGTATRDYSHVSDIVDGYNLILENDTEALRGEAINLASGCETRVCDIAAYIAHVLKVDIVRGEPRPGEVSRFPADISLAKSFGFSPRMNLFDGIARYIDWAREHNKG
ncbi:MAG: NAD-dependent epimerase/dehydratase family protein [Parcubacteria group bacterium]|nr:NAD-dependent epimerase/dehydratase family protein [Parcubacteria group bacterium]